MEGNAVLVGIPNSGRNSINRTNRPKSMRYRSMFGLLQDRHRSFGPFFRFAFGLSCLNIPVGGPVRNFFGTRLAYINVSSSDIDLVFSNLEKTNCHRMTLRPWDVLGVEGNARFFSFVSFVFPRTWMPRWPKKTKDDKSWPKLLTIKHGVATELEVRDPSTLLTFCVGPLLPKRPQFPTSLHECLHDVWRTVAEFWWHFIWNAGPGDCFEPWGEIYAVLWTR